MCQEQVSLLLFYAILKIYWSTLMVNMPSSLPNTNWTEYWVQTNYEYCLHCTSSSSRNYGEIEDRKIFCSCLMFVLFFSHMCWTQVYSCFALRTSLIYFENSFCANKTHKFLFSSLPYVCSCWLWFTTQTIYNIALFPSRYLSLTSNNIAYIFHPVLSIRVTLWKCFLVLLFFITIFCLLMRFSEVEGSWWVEI